MATARKGSRWGSVEEGPAEQQRGGSGDPSLDAPKPRKPARVKALGAAIALTVVAALVLVASSVGTRGPEPPGSATGLRVTVLDVGQGDAILFEPAGAPAVLIDGGPAGEGLAGKLGDAGVESLGAAVITHDQSDHAGGIEELLGGFPVTHLLYARLGREILAEGRAAGATVVRLAAGREVRSGELRLEVLWPPPELLSGPPEGTDPEPAGAGDAGSLARLHHAPDRRC